ncbi:MAG TPA: dihydroorotate dehydrogenase electron transfer subunit [Candidatus Binatia bacterium]|nr:dihydroorotate dehydrogenase electron transfer subunit [Candidatus Binatia bacterium]
MQSALAAPSIHATVVLDRREPGPGIVILGLEAPELVALVKPGHFLMAIPPAGVAAATALGIYEADGSRISVMLIIVGSRTAELARLQPGDQLDVLAPLGNGFFLDDLPKRVAIVAGGVGLASVLLAAKTCVERGARAELLYGARTKAALVDVELFEGVGASVRCATDDGSRGYRGFVTDLLEQGKPPELIIACGPTPMLRATAGKAEHLGVAAQLSLEETFGCGVGACWGCVVPIDRASPRAPSFPAADIHERREHANARVCKEGPVFWAHELRW